MNKFLLFLFIAFLINAVNAHAGENVYNVLEGFQAPASDFKNVSLREFGQWLERESRKIDPKGEGVSVKFRKKGVGAVRQEVLDKKLDFRTKDETNFLALFEYVASITRTRIVPKDRRTIEVIEAIEFREGDHSN